MRESEVKEALQGGFRRNCRSVYFYAVELYRCFIYSVKVECLDCVSIKAFTILPPVDDRIFDESS